ARGNAVHGVERHQLWRRDGGGETTGQVGPYDTMRCQAEAGPEQLPGRPGSIVGAAAQPLLMTRESGREVAGKTSERQTIGPVGPQHVAPRLAVPGGDIPPANRRAGARAFAVEDEKIVGARFHAELGRPAITDSRELRTQPPADPRHARRENPGTITLQLALWDGRRRGLRSE